jgi:multimeric flavodoxin WrbA
MEKSFAEAEDALRSADLLLFAYPVYTFLVPSQLHRFIELIKEHGVDLSGKYATQLTTSKHFYDTTAHQFIEDNCDDLGLRYITGLSADMEDLLSKKGQTKALKFFRYVCWNMKHGLYEPARYASSSRDTVGAGSCSNGLPAPQNTPTADPGSNGLPDPHDTATADPGSNGLPDTQDTAADPGGSGLPDTQDTAADPGSNGSPDPSKRIVVITDLPADGSGTALADMIGRFRENVSCTCDVVNIREFPFKGGCLGCFHCAADGTCIYKDGFDSYLRNNIQSSDAIVYAYTIRDHSMGSRFKMFDDRQFCNGHRTVTMGKPVGYLVEGDLANEPNLITLMEARAQVGGNFLAGIAVSGVDMGREVNQLALRICYAADHAYNPPKNFYGVGGLKIFRDLIYQMQGMMKEDHRFYKEHGFYDFPQKRKGTILGMYLVGAMMTNKKLRRKLGNKMTEGMLMPYKKILEKI